MKSVVIYYFSGTGNTEIVANMIKEEFIFRTAGGYNIKEILEHPCPTSEDAKRVVPAFFNNYVEKDSL